ncbi:unnamed protein product [Caenorhabditis auriculariae]|uniref:Lebercilin domain-containing protein n=1 Tax=Caenorhabditis auriculariae TaxID=2777116 RepID=A0A8S1H7X9_9PELO|nr:unnamed protein product [Caenorhabditis auriculariae]
MHVGVNEANIGESKEFKNEGENDVKPCPPNRHQFQRDLSRIHTTIDGTKEEIRREIDKCVAMNPQREELRIIRRDLSTKIESHRKEDINLKTALDELKRAQLDLEKDCRIRRKDQLDVYLANLETRYTNANLTIRDEQSLIQEIDALKRNRGKLDKLDEIANQRKDMEKKIEDLKRQKQGAYHALTTVKIQAAELLKTRKKHENRIGILKMNLNDINIPQKMKRFLRHFQLQIATRKLVRFENTFVEDEELEPFFEQKRDCKRLIGYLEQLKAMLPQEETTQTYILPQQMSTDDDSADELPSHLAKLSTSPPKAIITISNRKQFLKKSKTSQPISHQIEIFKMFGNVEVDAPKLYSDVPAILEEVKMKLAFFEQQTNEIEWDDEDLQLGSMSVSHTASEFTDSFYDDSSDANSVTSARRNFSRESCQSPLAERKYTITSDDFDADEGCSSK